MPKTSVQIELDGATLAVLTAYAASRRQPLDHAIYALLYRQAAVMSGWPGQAGQELERAMLAALDPGGVTPDRPEW